MQVICLCQPAAVQRIRTALALVHGHRRLSRRRDSQRLGAGRLIPLHAVAGMSDGVSELLGGTPPSIYMKSREEGLRQKRLEVLVIYGTGQAL